MNPFIFIGVGFSILIAIINVIVLCAIKFNDLGHLAKDVSDLKKDIKYIYGKVNKLCSRMSFLEGKLVTKK